MEVWKCGSGWNASLGFVCIALFLTAGGRAGAQGEVPAQPPVTQGQESGSEEAAAPDVEEAKPPDRLQLLAAPGFGANNLSGSRRDFYHYHHPPSGLYFNLLQAIHRDVDGFPLQEVWWRNAGAPDEKGFFDLHLRSDPSYVRLWRDTASFYGDPQDSTRQFSTRQDTRVRAHLAKFGWGPTLDLYLWDRREEIPGLARFAPLPGINYHAPETAIRLTAPVLGGTLYLEPRHLTVDNHVGRVPDSETTWLSGELVRPFGERFDLSLAYDRVTTDVTGMQGTAAWNIFRAQGNLQPTRSLLIQGFYRHQGADLPFTSGRYADRSALAGLEANATPARHLMLEGGLLREEIRRKNGDTGQHETTAWTGGWSRLRYSRPGLFRLDLRYREKRLADAPAAEIEGLSSTDTLFYTSDRSADARLDGYLGPRVNAYLSYGWRRRDNGQRDTRLTLNTGTLGATAQLTSRLSLTGEFTQQSWRGNVGPLLVRGGNPDGLLPPQLFFSDGRILTGAVAYQLDPRSALEFSYNSFNSTGGQSARDTLGVLQYRREVSRSFFYSVGYEYDSFKDSRLDRRFTGFPLLLEVGYQHRFR